MTGLKANAIDTSRRKILRGLKTFSKYLSQQPNCLRFLKQLVSGWYEVQVSMCNMVKIYTYITNNHARFHSDGDGARFINEESQ